MKEKEEKLIRVFIASPGDVQEERKMLFEVIKELNKPESPLKKRGCMLKALGWEDVPPDMKRPQQTILDHYPVHSWDIFIGILWGRFGTPPGKRGQKTGSDYESGTEEEFDRSYDYWKKTKRPRIMVYRCMRELPPAKVDGGQLEKVKVFFKEFECAGRYPGLYQKYETVDQLRERVKSDLEYVVINLMIPFMPPPPPKNFIDRDDIVEKLKERLINGEDIGIHGLPGVGKTAVALAIVNDSQVREHFNGGILWAPLGKNRDVLAVLGNCAGAMGISLNEIADAKTVEARKMVIIKSIGEKPILMVIDDARRDSEAESLKIDCPQCAHILTSPNLHVANAFTGGAATAMSGLDEQDSLELLCFHAPPGMEMERVHTDAKRLVNAVSGLPQALIMVGERLKKKAAGLPSGFLKKELNELLSKGKLPLNEFIRDSYDDLDNDAKVILQYLLIFPPEPNSFFEDAALAVSGKTNDEIECLRSLFEHKFLEFKEDENSCRYMLSNAISNFAIGKCTDEAAKTAKQRMVNFYVNYVKEHEEENTYLEPEIENIKTALQAAYDLDMKEDLLKGVNAFFHYMETNGLYELAEKQLKRAEEAGRSLGDEKELAAALHHLGDVAYIHIKYKDAEKYYKESLELAGKNKDATLIIDSMKGLGDIFGVHGEFYNQEKHYKGALEKAREIDNRGEIIDLLIRLGRMEDINGNYDKAKEYLQEAMDTNAGDDKLTNSKLYADLGWVDAHLGDFNQAKEHWRKGLKLAKEINHKGNMSFLHSNLGWLEDRWGNLEQAEKHFETVINIAREIGYLNMIGVILTNMGAAKIHRGDYENAMKDLKEGLDIVEKSGHVERTGVLRENLAIVSCRLGNYDEAKLHLNKGMEVAQKGIIERVSALCTYMGELAIYQEDYIKAEKHLQMGLEKAEKIKNPERLGLVYKDLGVLADRQGNLEQAELYLNEALAQAQEINYQWLLSSIYYALGEHWYKKRNYRFASINFNDALRIGERIRSRDMIDAAKDGLKRLERTPAS